MMYTIFGLRDESFRVFAIETAGVWTFGIYWMLKTAELGGSSLQFAHFTEAEGS